jgi:hypothetical protein
MNTQEITTTNLLINYAKTDVRLAKKYGQIAIHRTQSGNVEIQYNAETSLYQAVDFNNTNIQLTEPIAKKEMVIFIASIYVVV